MPTIPRQPNLIIDIHSQTYPIFIAENLLSETGLLTRFIHGKKIMIVSQQPIAGFYLDYLTRAFENFVVDQFIFKAGEQYKTLAQWEKLLVAMLRLQHDRSSTLIALGGGVVGDLTGFAAACYMRGINYLQIPTTLIAQIDAAVGGKTAVNHALGKNLVGAFYHPKAVFIDVNTLATLPDREYIAGLAEAIKYGLIMDAKFFAWLENHMDDLLAKDKPTLLTLIQTCLTLKASLVKEDEKEVGRRSLLNFGHTFGHALEALTEYKTLLHGEAVAIGMLMAANLSQLPDTELARIQNLISQCGLGKIAKLPLSVDSLLAFMQQDKKNKDDQIHLILLKSIGEAYKTAKVPISAIREVIQQQL